MAKISLLYACLGLGGLTAVTLTGVALGGGFSSQKIVKLVDPKNRVYTWDCYKWIIDRKTAGEVWACNDMREADTSKRSLIFVLWWLPTGEGEGYNTFTEIDQINLESGTSLSFKFTSGGNKYSNRKLQQPTGLYWKDASKLEKQPPLDWSKISGKNLKSECKLENKELVCGTNSSVFRASKEQVLSKPRFKLIY